MKRASDLRSAGARRGGVRPYAARAERRARPGGRPGSGRPGERACDPRAASPHSSPRICYEAVSDRHDCVVRRSGTSTCFEHPSARRWRTPRPASHLRLLTTIVVEMRARIELPRIRALFRAGLRHLPPVPLTATGPPRPPPAPGVGPTRAATKGPPCDESSPVFRDQRSPRSKRF